MKHFLLFFCSALLIMCSHLTAGAQDKLYLRDGTVLKVKVKEVGPRNIIYKKWDNQDGPEYFVTRREVESIRYENGTEEFIDGRAARRRAPRMDEDDDERSKDRTVARDDDDRPARPSRRDRARAEEAGYGRNILSLAPVQMTNESVAGIGLHYEHMLDKQQLFSLSLPVAVSFFTDEYYDPNGFHNRVNRTFTYFYPGIKVYPARSTHRASYSIGAAIALGFGNKYKREEVQIYDPLSGTYSTQNVYKEGQVFKSGFMINNGLNLQPTKHFYIGLEFGIGFPYTNNESDNFSIGDGDPLVQFNFKAGYRF